MKIFLNTVFITRHKERIPIMFYKIDNNPFEVDIHVQLIDVEVSKTHTIHVRVTNKYTNEKIFEGDQSFNMESDGQKPEGYENVNRGIAELGIPLSMEPDEIKGVNTLNIEVTIEGSKQNVQLFLAGDVNG
ncbi:hypothetical protein [Limosilactobacillus reuteri]|uniref:DUF4352 domain-containing protein n=1 Tax=Limosilactobacillus reuteri TaxID=1598 RepID=A0A7X2KI69_LIMRT|nr:hypothetical protein [Limosilactobacillus reuteri]MRG89889.1 hypothetical protein [Limosilactobacillus reuteri]